MLIWGPFWSKMKNKICFWKEKEKVCFIKVPLPFPSWLIFIFFVVPLGVP